MIITKEVAEKYVATNGQIDTSKDISISEESEVPGSVSPDEIL